MGYKRERVAEREKCAKNSSTTVMMILSALPLTNYILNIFFRLKKLDLKLIIAAAASSTVRIAERAFLANFRRKKNVENILLFWLSLSE